MKRSLVDVQSISILYLMYCIWSCTLGSICVSLPEDELWCNSSSDVSSFSSNEEVLILTLSSHPKQDSWVCVAYIKEMTCWILSLVDILLFQDFGLRKYHT